MSIGSNPTHPAIFACFYVKTIDMHVHMVGNEASENGCWIRVTAGKYPLYALMLSTLGLPVASLKQPNFDEIYRD